MNHSIASKNILTYSAFSTFRACPRKYKNRYEDGLKPTSKVDSLYFGQMIHEAMTLCYQTGGNRKVLWRYLDQAFPKNETEFGANRVRLMAYAMLNAYAEYYAQEKFEIVGLDVEFIGEIRNPRTGRESRTFLMAGKANGIVERDGELYLLEHRTASTAEEIDADKLWADSKAALYCHYLRQNGYPVVGVIYNMLVKTRIRPKANESDEEFAQRLQAWYAQDTAFQRLTLRIPESRLTLLESEIWEVTQQYLGARRRQEWLMNTASCFCYNRPCEYLPWCRSNFQSDHCAGLYEIKPPHEELPILGLNLLPPERKRYEEVRRQRCAD